MKRILLILLCGIVCGSFCAAQIMLGNYSQRGRATRDLPDEGLSAAHNILPLGSKVTVKNTLNGMETEVTIVGRIPPSLDRIIDLSPAAATVIDLQDGGTVIVSIPYTPLPRPAAVTAMSDSGGGASADKSAGTNEAGAGKANGSNEAKSASTAGSSVAGVKADGSNTAGTGKTNGSNEANGVYAAGAAPDTARQENVPFELIIKVDINITETPVAAKTASPETPSAGRDTAQRAGNTRVLPGLPGQAAAVESVPAQTVFSGYSAGNARILPNLPDPASGKMYHLQIGAYSLPGNAERAVRRLQSAGFKVKQEVHGSLRRILAADIPATAVQSAAQQLAGLGFTELWLREKLP